MAIIEGAVNGGGIVKLPGVGAIIQEVSILPSAKSAVHECLRFRPSQLEPGSRFPNPKWAICTSSTRKYATSVLGVAGIVIPDAFVAAEDVEQGKPA